MKRHDFSQWQCSIARTTDLLGDWWTPLILRDAANGLDTFDAFQSNLGISRNTLTQRLERLVSEDMLEKVKYNARPARYRYVLTTKGISFVPVLLAMKAWGDHWFFEDKPCNRVRHKTCGTEVFARIVCNGCGEDLHLHDLEPIDNLEFKNDLEPNIGSKSRKN